MRLKPTLIFRLLQSGLCLVERVSAVSKKAFDLSLALEGSLLVSSDARLRSLRARDRAVDVGAKLGEVLSDDGG
ncbi:hypothetical protein C8R45DRAFT_1017601 [Mycena sanguinolenta]|nr:hypothetical protein C8R45DRAFT_1017601 [Mycena sanguinolenta]